MVGEQKKKKKEGTETDSDEGRQHQLIIGKVDLAGGIQVKVIILGTHHPVEGVDERICVYVCVPSVLIHSLVFVHDGEVVLICY